MPFVSGFALLAGMVLSFWAWNVLLPAATQQDLFVSVTSKQRLPTPFNAVVFFRTSKL